MDRARVETLDESGRLSERNLAGHLINGNGKSETTATMSRSLIERDNQLYEALTLLKGINILSPRRGLPAGQQTAAAQSG